MMPKTEKELLVYFKLVELERLYVKTLEAPPYLTEYYKEKAMDNYLMAKNEYLALINNED